MGVIPDDVKIQCPEAIAQTSLLRDALNDRLLLRPCKRIGIQRSRRRSGGQPCAAQFVHVMISISVATVWIVAGRGGVVSSG